MTFERQVAAALAATHETWCDRKCDCRGEDEAARLAPLVAAAITAAAGYAPNDRLTMLAERAGLSALAPSSNT